MVLSSNLSTIYFNPRWRSLAHSLCRLRFFYGVAALVLCYKSVKKVTFIGHPSVMTTVKNSPRIILMT